MAGRRRLLVAMVLAGSGCAGVLGIEDLVPGPSPPELLDGGGSDGVVGLDAGAGGDAREAGSWCAENAPTAKHCDDFDVGGAFSTRWSEVREVSGRVELDTDHPFSGSTSLSSRLRGATTRFGQAIVSAEVDAGPSAVTVEFELRIASRDPAREISVFRLNTRADPRTGAYTALNVTLAGDTVTLGWFAEGGDAGPDDGLLLKTSSKIPSATTWRRYRISLGLVGARQLVWSIDGVEEHNDATPAAFAVRPLTVAFGLGTTSETPDASANYDNIVFDYR